MNLRIDPEKYNKKTLNIRSKKIGITGTIYKNGVRLTRDKIVDIIQENGGIYTNIITQDTNYVIIGEDYGVRKYNLVKKYNITILKPDELFNLN